LECGSVSSRLVLDSGFRRNDGFFSLPVHGEGWGGGSSAVGQVSVPVTPQCARHSSACLSFLVFSSYIISRCCICTIHVYISPIIESVEIPSQICFAEPLCILLTPPNTRDILLCGDHERWICWRTGDQSNESWNMDVAVCTGGQSGISPFAGRARLDGMDNLGCR